MDLDKPSQTPENRRIRSQPQDLDILTIIFDSYAEALMTRTKTALMCLLLAPSALLVKGRYVAYTSYQEWLSLVPEEQSLQICGLTKDGHSLWAQGQLRVPEEMFLRGNFSGTGRNDWFVRLHQSTSETAPCDYVLIVAQTNGVWQRLFFEKIAPTGASWEPVWSSQRDSIGIDVGQRRRRSAPAQMTWSDGTQSFKAGYVVEDAFINAWIEWNKDKKIYEYKRVDSGEWWEIEQK